MSHVSWKAHFTQPISGYDPMEAQGLSELGYALLKRQIPEQEYLAWARENFELASVDMKFFQTHSAPKEIFEKVKDAYAWGPECLPIAEWDDHLLVAGLHKPEDFPQELKPIFLLAPVNGLLAYWSKFQTENAEISEEGEVVAEESGMPEGFSFDSSAPSTPAQNTGISFSGVTLAPTLATTNSPSAKKENKPSKADVKATPTPIKISEDTGLRPLEVSANSLLSKVKKPEVKAEPTPISSYTMPPQNPKTPPPAKSNVEVPKIKIAEPSLDDILTSPGIESAVSEDTVPEVKSTPQVIPMKLPASASATSEKLEMPEESIKQVFAECKKHYEKQLYVEFNHTDKTAIVKYWTSEYVATETPAPHTLIKDSFLAIVSKTQKSYHGYIVKSETADKFFKEVNSGNLPDNVTAVPFTKDDAVVGILMGWGNKTTYSLSVLRDLERSVNAMCLKLNWAKTDAA